MYDIKKQFARLLRHESTEEEKIVWKMLRNRKYRNLKFRRQHVIDGFVIEIDGKIHDKQKDYDKLRQSLIETKGFRFIRITNKQLRDDEFILYRMLDKYCVQL